MWCVAASFHRQPLGLWKVDLTTTDGTFTASVPSGASTGAYEACELRDGGSRYMGKGVLQAVKNVNEVLAPLILGMDPTNQEDADQKMLDADGTTNKENLGANAILGVSLALAKAGAAAKGVPLYKHFADLAGNTEKFVLPTPCFNVINGGSHAGNRLAFQEYFVIPTGAETFKEAMQIGCEVYHNLAKVIKAKYGGDATLIGDEGGFAPPCDQRSGVELIMEAIAKAGYTDKCTIGLDVAASEFKVKGKDAYDLDFKTDGGAKDASLMLSGSALSDFYEGLIKVDICVLHNFAFQGHGQDYCEGLDAITGANREGRYPSTRRRGASPFPLVALSPVHRTSPL